jgi:hypothetical protein
MVTNRRVQSATGTRPGTIAESNTPATTVKGVESALPSASDARDPA